MNKDIEDYNNALGASDREICDLLATEINKTLNKATSKIWHGSPVWFLEDNPVVGYSKQKLAVNLLFWSGQSFDESGLSKEGSFKAAEVKFTDKDQVNLDDLKRWLEKSEKIQWDYKNIVKRRGQLERIK